MGLALKMVGCLKELVIEVHGDIDTLDRTEQSYKLHYFGEHLLGDVQAVWENRELTHILPVEWPETADTLKRWECAN